MVVGESEDTMDFGVIKEVTKRVHGLVRGRQDVDA